jgi:hypothetical protein
MTPVTELSVSHQRGAVHSRRFSGNSVTVTVFPPYSPRYHGRRPNPAPLIDIVKDASWREGMAAGDPGCGCMAAVGRDLTIHPEIR